MTRTEENQIIFDQWKNLTINGKPEVVNINLKIAEINVLMDISKSLAMMADMKFASLTLPNNFRFDMKGDDDNGK